MSSSEQTTAPVDVSARILKIARGVTYAGAVLVLWAAILGPPLRDVGEILAAVIPSVWLLAYFISQDRFPEPAEVILGTFVCGVLATIPAIAAEAMIRKDL